MGVPGFLILSSAPQIYWVLGSPRLLGVQGGDVASWGLADRSFRAGCQTLAPRVWGPYLLEVRDTCDPHQWKGGVPMGPHIP